MWRSHLVIISCAYVLFRSTTVIFTACCLCQSLPWISPGDWLRSKRLSNTHSQLDTLQRSTSEKPGNSTCQQFVAADHDYQVCSIFLRGKQSCRKSNPDRCGNCVNCRYVVFSCAYPRKEQRLAFFLPGQAVIPWFSFVSPLSSISIYAASGPKRGGIESD